MNIEILKEFLLPTVMSIFLAYIAYQQMKTNKNKLKLDLYNKRFEIYTNALKFYQELIGEEVSKETHLKFINSKEASIFLFSKDIEIYKLLDEMHSKSFKVIGFKKHGKDIACDPAVFLKSNNEMQQVLSWFNEQVPELRKKMQRYLAL